MCYVRGLLVLFALLFGLSWLLVGCGSLNTQNVEALTTLVDKLDLRGSGVVDDPELHFFIYTESGVGVRVEGIHAQGSGQGTPTSQPAE